MVTKRNADGTTVTTRSTSETGHAKNAAAFTDIIKGVTDFDTKYQPSNERIQLWQLEQKQKLVHTAMDNWGTARQNDDDAENQRTEIFGNLPTYATRITNALISSGNISPLTIQDAQSIMKKIRGTRSAKGTKEIAEAKTAGSEQPRTSSVSQQSYDQKLAHFIALRKLVTAQPTYNPNEADLQLSGLITYESQLTTSNNVKIDARSKLIDARNERNIQLYHEETGVIQLSKEIKSYVKSVFGSTHVNYKKINGIPFKLIKDKASTLQ
jgi:hypothetical protein